jgi:lipoate---protein ligase
MDQRPVGEWRLLDISDPDPFLNMAIEEAILRSVGAGEAPPTLRLWQNRNAVIIGYFQDAAVEADLDACRSLGTAVVRRVSGGGAVYHDGGNLNYAAFVPLNHPGVPQDVLESYRYFCAGVIAALASLGLKAEFAPINDIVVGGRKVSGTAQARRYGGILHHGTLMLHLDIAMMAKTLRVTRAHLEKKGVKSVTERVATLEQLGRPTSIADAKAALVEGFARALGVTFKPGEMTAAEWALARSLREDKYCTEEWNLKTPEERREDKGHLG